MKLFNMVRQWLDSREFMHNMFILLCKEVAHRMCVLQTGIILQILVGFTVTVKSEEQLGKEEIP